MLRLITDSVEDPAVDTAVSTVLLRRVAAGKDPASLRLFVPGRVVAFGRQDTVRPGFHRAAAAVADLGYTPIERLAGGRAAVFHESTLAFAWAMPADDPRISIGARFEAMAKIVVAALEALGVDARVGEVPGEYCPGTYSVNVRGERKVMGVGQRLVRGAAHVGGVVVVDRPDLVNAPLVPAYEALGYDWEPKATGAVSEEAPVTLDAMQDAIVAAFHEAGHDLVASYLDPEVLSEAMLVAAEHRIA